MTVCSDSVNILWHLHKTIFVHNTVEPTLGGGANTQKVLSNLWSTLQLRNAHQCGVAIKKNVLNNALHIVTGCLHSTPTDNSLTCELVFGRSIYPCTNMVPLRKPYATYISMLYYQPPHVRYSLTVWDDKTPNCQSLYSILLQAAYYLSSTAWSSNKTNFQSK